MLSHHLRPVTQSAGVSVNLRPPEFESTPSRLRIRHHLPLVTPSIPHLSVTIPLYSNIYLDTRGRVSLALGCVSEITPRESMTEGSSAKPITADDAKAFVMKLSQVHVLR